MDKQSILGYAYNSPFRNRPYLDINTPDGLITMENTPVDLLGIDELGHTQHMKAGSKNMYQFPGTKVREIPMQPGGLFQSNKTAYVDSVFAANKNLEWVRRLYEKNPQTVQIPGQPYSSTHFMQSGRSMVYPTVANVNGQLQYLGSDARRYADSTKTGIKFPNDQQAQWFGENYKIGTGVLPNFAKGGPTPHKACEMLRDGTANGKKLTAKQKRYFGFLCGKTKKQEGGNPYQMGGITKAQMFNFLFDDEEDTPTKKEEVPTAPSTEEIEEPKNTNQESEQLYQMALDVAMQGFAGNPYRNREGRQQRQGNPYADQILSSGQFGDQNVGEYGRQIYGDLVNSLGYKPTVSSIFRSKEQNDALIAAGKPAVKNSWHLTGNAVDVKPVDWHKLSNEQQAYYRSRYDVVYHDNHYHIEPK